MSARWLSLALFLALPTFLHADEPKKIDTKKEAILLGKPGLVPYRLTDTHHTLVRVKINGKGPFNFVVDTGCPVFLIAEPVGKKIGLKNGWVTLDKLEMEGGLELTKVKARVETPFQIEGMNAMGLPGVELHGLMGYTVLAKYKMEFDFTTKQMVWTPVKTEPLPPLARGFFGFEMEEKDGEVRIKNVLADSPAAKAGLKKGDRIVRIEAKEVKSISEVMEQTTMFLPGKTATFAIERGQKKQDLKITAGEGKGGGTPGGMDFMVKALTFVAALAGVGPAPPPQPRGFFGFELGEKDKNVFVARVLTDSPAAKAGLKKGDRIVTVESAEVSAINDVLQKASKLTAGKTLTLMIERNNKKQELKITAGEGL
jgi:hypothetical protein